MPQTGTIPPQVGLGGMVLPVAPGSCGLSGLVKYRRTWERMGSGGLRGPQTVARRAKRLGCVRFTYVPAIRYQRFCARGLLRAAKALFCFVTGPSRRLVFGDGAWLRAPGFEYADGGVLPYDYRKTGRSFLRRPGGRAVVAHGLRQGAHDVLRKAPDQSACWSGWRWSAESWSSRPRARTSFAYLEECEFGGLLPRVAMDVDGPAGCHAVASRARSQQLGCPSWRSSPATCRSSRRS